MDSDEYDRVIARVLQVAPNEMTFEDGMRIFEFMTSFSAMFRQAEAAQPVPDPAKLADFDAAADGFLKARAELIALWQRMVREHQPRLRDYYALISANPKSTQ